MDWKSYKLHLRLCVYECVCIHSLSSGNKLNLWSHQEKNWVEIQGIKAIEDEVIYKKKTPLTVGSGIKLAEFKCPGVNEFKSWQHACTLQYEEKKIHPFIFCIYTQYNNKNLQFTFSNLIDTRYLCLLPHYTWVLTLPQIQIHLLYKPLKSK